MNKNIPEFLYSLLINQYGEELTKSIIKGYESDRLTTLRVNNLKTDLSSVEEVFKSENIEFEKVDWYENAYIIKNVSENEIRKLKIYDEGKIYLQSLSSMLPPIILNPKEKENILDMAAAPGGKTTEMAALTNNNAFITACEMNKIRSDRLKYNIEKQGAKGIFVMVTDSRKMDDFFSFDKILLDAPCSGSGTLNAKDEKIERYFTKLLIEKSSSIQISLLKKALKMLKPGNEMVYSTCSILEDENEKVLQKILKEEKVQIVPIESEKIKNIPKLPTKIEGTLCVCPNELFEGFFVAKLKKI